MDLLTHGFVPYAAMTWLRRPRAHRALAAIGGMAPDLDAAFAWLSHAHPHAYPLVHRGVSHTLWGAPLLATLLLLVLSRPVLHKRWPRMAVFTWTPQALTPLWLGSFTHLVLDGITITGVPLLWPFDQSRWTTNWLFFGILFFLPFSLFALVQLARGKLSDRAVKRISFVLLWLLLLSAILRVVSLPDDRAPGSHLTPGPNEWTWYVTQRNDTGVLIHGTGWLGERQPTLFIPEPNRTAAAAAIEACRRHPAYVPWAWDLWAPEAVNASPTPDGGWVLVFQDPAQQYIRVHPPYSMPRFRGDDNNDGASTCTVRPDGTADFDRERGWFGS